MATLQSAHYYNLHCFHTYDKIFTRECGISEQKQQQQQKAKAMFLLRWYPKASFQMTKVCISSTYVQWEGNTLHSSS